jgi:hypothetical protein
MIVRYFFYLACFLFSGNNLFAQPPVLRKGNPVKETGISNKSIRNPTVTKDTTPVLTRIGAGKFSVLNNALPNMFSLLEFSNFSGGSAEFPLQWEFKKTDTKEITDNPISKNWKKTFTWRRIPEGTAFGRWEISLYPFPFQDTPEFSGIIRSGIVETKGADSVYFEINYTDAQPERSPTRGETVYKKEAASKIQPVRTRTAENSRLVKKENNTPAIVIEKNKINFPAVMQLLEETRKFYIRMVPLNSGKQPLTKISNEVRLQEIYFKEIQPAKKQVYLPDDYTITAVKYFPIQYADPNFANCTVIASYHNPEKPDNAKQNAAFGFGDNDIYNMNAGKFSSYFQAAFPVGTVLCPKPPKEKPWYEKAFDGVTGFTIKAWDGAAGFYNTTKGYIKDKFVELNCNAGLVTTVINPVSKLQEAAGPEVCGLIAEAAFDYGMAAVGIPPSIPTSDEFAKLAEGQIVDVACDELESQTGVPLPPEAREAIRKEFHDKVVAQSNNGIVNCGFFNVKPDPRGMFRTAYYEIEITRTGNNYKGKGIVGISVEDLTTRTLQLWNPSTKQNETVTLTGNLFEHAAVKIPFIENVGDKKKLYLILKPQESYLHKDKKTNMINSVHHSPPPNEFYNPLPVDPSYYSITNSPGFNVLSGSGSISTFSFGLKNYQLTYTNK